MGTTDPINMKTYPTLYTVDNLGRVRVWLMQRAGDKYRSVSGTEDGLRTKSGWTVATPKNEGRKNGTTGEEQAHAEMMAEYGKKLKRKYYEDRASVGGSKHVSPMLAQKYTSVPEGLFYTQPKLDGMRCVASKDGLFSRTGERFTSCKHVEEALAEFFVDENANVTLDGELYNHKLRDDFSRLASLIRGGKRQAPEVQYHVYDGVWCGQNFGARSVWLKENVPWSPTVHRVETLAVSSEAQLDEAFGRFLSLGYEGQMVRLDGPYECKRSKLLLKRKEFEDQEFPVLAVEEGLGNWAGYAKRIILSLPDGRTFGAGVKGDQTFTKQLLLSARSEKGAPRLATVRYQNLTPDGIPRFPVAVDFHYGAGRVD